MLHTVRPRVRPAAEVIRLPRNPHTPSPRAECLIEAAFPRNERVQGEETFVHRDGHFYPVFVTAGPLVRGGHAVGTLVEVRDISADRRAERRMGFLAELGLALQPITDPAEAMATAARLLGEYLRADRCAYAEVEADEDHFTLTGTWWTTPWPTPA